MKNLTGDRLALIDALVAQTELDSVTGAENRYLRSEWSYDETTTRSQDYALILQVEPTVRRSVLPTVDCRIGKLTDYSASLEGKIFTAHKSAGAKRSVTTVLRSVVTRLRSGATSVAGSHRPC